MFHVKQLRSYYTNPYKVSEDVRDNVSEYTVDVDAWTVVSEDDYLANVLASKWAKYSDFAQKAGNKVKPMRIHNYGGFQVGSMRYGVVPNTVKTLLSVTGSLSGVTYEDMLQYSLRATRVDVQSTFFLISPMPDLVSQMYDARQMRGENWRGGLKRWKLIQGKEGDTLYVGTRGSGKFIRVYDKSFQYSGNISPGWVWRFEMEYGTGYSDALWQDMRDIQERKGDIKEYLIKRLWGDLWGMGVALPVSIEAMADNERKKVTRVSDKDRYISWLNNTVRPVVSWLIAMGYGTEVSESLDLQKNFLDLVDGNDLVQATLSLLDENGDDIL